MKNCYFFFNINKNYIFLFMLALLFHSLRLVSATPFTTPEVEGSDNVNAVSMSTIVGEDMRREKVDVSFSAGSNGTLTMIVTHNGDTIVCSNLVDDVSDATEVRQSDGSFTKVYGTDGHSLRSSVDGIECRAALFNARQRPYTLADVPHPPGYLSAHIILHNGEVLDVERDDMAEGYVSLCPHHVPQHRRRRLQSYHEFSCKLDQLKILRMGVVVDQAYLRSANNDRGTARQKLLALFSKVSALYEKQLNVKIHVAQLLFHDDPLVQGERWTRCGEPSQDLNRFTAWRRNKVPDKMAAWYFAIGCNHRAGTAGVAWVGTMGMAASRFGNGGSTGVGFSQLVTTAHEIGHNFGAVHTFDSPHRRRQGAGNGLMDYTPSGKWQNVVQFHSLHDREICAVLRRMLRGGSGFVTQEEMWGTTPPTPNPPAPPNPNPPPPSNPNPPPPSNPNPPPPSNPNPPPPSNPNPPTPPNPNPPTPSNPNPPTPSNPNPPTPSNPKPPAPPDPKPPTPPTPDPDTDKPTTPDVSDPGTDGEEPESESNTTLYIILAVIAAVLLLWCLQRNQLDAQRNTRKKERETAHTKPMSQRASGRKKPLLRHRPAVCEREKKNRKHGRGVRRRDSKRGRSPTSLKVKPGTSKDRKEPLKRERTQSSQKKSKRSKERKEHLKKDKTRSFKKNSRSSKERKEFFKK